MNAGSHPRSIEKAAETSSEVATYSLIGTAVLIVVLAVVILIWAARQLALPDEVLEYNEDAEPGLLCRPPRQISYDTFKGITYRTRSVDSNGSRTTAFATPTDAATPDTSSSGSNSRMVRFDDSGPTRVSLHWLRDDFLPWMQERSLKYLGSNWGSNRLSANNPLNRLAKQCKNGTINLSLLYSLEKLLNYREMTMGLAVERVHSMSLNHFPEPGDFDAYKWIQTAKVGDESYMAIHNLVDKARLIPDPKPGQGKFHPKPIVYIAAALLERTTDEKEAQRLITEEQTRLERQKVARQRLDVLEYLQRRDQLAEVSYKDTANNAPLVRAHNKSGRVDVVRGNRADSKLAKIRDLRSYLIGHGLRPCFAGCIAVRQVEIRSATGV